MRSVSYFWEAVILVAIVGFFTWVVSHVIGDLVNQLDMMVR